MRNATCAQRAVVCAGMGVVAWLPGYFSPATNAGDAWACHGSDNQRCPGGDPGTSATRRVNTSIARGECEVGTRSSNDGPGVACDGADVWVFYFC